VHVTGPRHRTWHNDIMHMIQKITIQKKIDFMMLFGICRQIPDELKKSSQRYYVMKQAKIIQKQQNDIMHDI
jgi:hypothetical protein